MRRVHERLREEWRLAILLAALPVLLWLTPGSPSQTAVRLPVGRRVIFEALAVNAGSALSPVGNPQNLYLWQSAGVPFLEFGLAMAPLAGGLMLALLAAIPLGFAGRRVSLTENLPGLLLQRGLLWLTLILYPVLLVCAESGWSLPGAGVVIALYLVAARRVLRGVDWALLWVFALMFVDLGLLAGLPAVAALAAGLDQAPGGVLTAGILLSQLISNVPAAIFLAGFTDDWRMLAWLTSGSLETGLG